MQYSDTTNKDGIVEEVDFLVNSNSTTYPIADKTRNANRALDRVVSLILSVDGEWQFDDLNYTDQPIAKTNLVANQYDYTFNAEQLRVLRIEAKDSAGNWTLLRQTNYDQIHQALLEYKDTAGIPNEYDVHGSSIFLYPVSDVNITDGLRVHFQRTSDYFTAGDTTKQPGFAKNFHRLISLHTAYDFALAKRLDQISLLKQEILILEKELVDFYSRRDKVIQPKLQVKVRSSR